MSIVKSLSTLGYLVSALGLLVLGAFSLRRWFPIAAVTLNLVFVAALTGTAFGEDSYVGDGSSNWSHRAEGSHLLYVLGLLLAMVAAALFAVLATRHTRSTLTRPMLVLSGIANLVSGLVVLIAFESN